MKRFRSRRLSAIAVTLVVVLIVLAAPVSALAAAQPDHPQPAAAHLNSSCVVIVRAGDDLFRIAFRNGVSIQVIEVMNHLANPNLIFVGQRLFMPCVVPITSFTPPIVFPVVPFVRPFVFPRTFPSAFPDFDPNMFPTMPFMFHTMPNMFPMFMPGMFP